MSYWSDKTVLITGAASGIGRATALRFAGEGASVAMLDRNEKGLEQTRQMIGDDSRTRTFAVDLEDEPAVREAVRSSTSWSNQLQAAVNVAGIGAPEQFPDSTREDVGQPDPGQSSGRLRGGSEGGPAHDPGRRRRHRQRLQHPGPGCRPQPDHLLGHQGRRQWNHPRPGDSSGRTQYPRQRGLPRRRGHPAVGRVDRPPARSRPDPATIAAAYPLGHYCDPEDIAGCIFFLAGPDARCITGTEIVVDCGLTVKCY